MLKCLYYQIMTLFITAASDCYSVSRIRVIEQLHEKTCSLLLTVLRQLIWCNSYFMLFRVGVSCRFLYYIVNHLYVICNGSMTSVGEERELICLLSFTFKYVVSVRRGILFGWAALFYCGTPWAFHIVISCLQGIRRGSIQTGL